MSYFNKEDLYFSYEVPEHLPERLADYSWRVNYHKEGMSKAYKDLEDARREYEAALGTSSHNRLACLILALGNLIMLAFLIIALGNLIMLAAYLILIFG